MTVHFGEVTKPLTTKEIGDRIYHTEERRISGDIWVSLNEVIASDLEGFLDLISQRLTESGVLTDIECRMLGVSGSIINLLVSGDATDLLSDYDDGDNGTTEPAKQYIVVEGNLADGFRFYGPFADQDEANSSDVGRKMGAWVATLIPTKGEGK